MTHGVDAVGCTHQIHESGARGHPEPTQVCSCAAGLVHMVDCPVSLGLPCVHFEPLENPEPVARQEAEAARERLMESYLDRVYFHRVRSLSPEPSAWQRHKEELNRRYQPEAEAELGEEEVADVSGYEAERDRILERRRRLEAERAEAAEKEQAAATERQRRGIKTVVQRAQESVAARGNVMSSYLDDVELPPSKEGGQGRRRRRRGRRSNGDSGAAGGSPARKSGTAGKRRRRRRRRPGGPAA